MANQLIEDKLKLLPDQPGCYIMKNARDQVIYIGKAKNLKNRVRSYFKSSHTGKTAQLVSEIADYDYIVTKTDKESLLLEINLIQKHQPHYNIKLKHGTMYPYLKITNEEDPQLIITSEVKNDGGYYFGPYPNVYAATGTRDLLQKTYPLRKCSKNEKRACFYYHIGQCIGCCDHHVSKEEYDDQIKRIRRFLNGDVKTIKNDLENKMAQAAEDMHYERAAEYRDQISYIEQTVEPQNIMSKQYNNRDVFAFYMDKGWISIQVFMLRQFSIIKRDSALFPCYDDPEEELTSYIIQFYQHQNHTLPKEILVPKKVDNTLISDTLDVAVATPQRGDKHKMLKMAYNNAKVAHQEKFRLLEMQEEKTVGAVETLSQVLNLPYLKVIESFDHSNIQGTNPVSAMVVYEDGKPNKKLYRKYNIKSVKGANEYLTTQEVIRRRYGRLLREGKALPDLILMDGGAIEVNAAKEVLVDELNLSIPVAGMVKDDKHRTANLIFGEDLAIVPLEPTSPAFHLLQRIQDEVHRFAISFHRQVRSKHSFSSRLDAIPGVGPKTRTKVMRHFKTLKAIRQGGVPEIQKLGIPEKVALAIHKTAWEGQTDDPYAAETRDDQTENGKEDKSL
ncbi:excinuclease ABC subunit UvrC [Aerococcus kribbianus]|uniref:UvrABC system protein C n=1 Tax=Aerococcus kribbianus TaxID=2999064 RepID=A0A9X3JHB2_9LACT|nr:MULTISPECIES: excinuclease ABC subunit UvrC [unclassified Aerococcus]MCZ0718027.1 excinuclease ABC subunit UvrC [Aerococcus sp. YH-aer221]MCZ0726404.1 excinuclease ABC subunit UvrC [Aerococcus sp. YH-aer222]